MSNRRNFLKILGTGFAAASANPLMAAGAAKMKAPVRPLKIGVLTPQSTICPQYPYSFMNGFRLGIDQNKALKKQHIEIVNEPNGFGTPFISKQNAHKLLYENNVDLMVGILGTEVANQFEALFTKKQVPFIVCNTGEYFPVHKLRNNPYLFFNTLNLYQSAYQSGQFATSKYGKRGVVVTSLYDSGYDSLFAFSQGVTTSGGILEETHVMKTNEQNCVSKAIDRISQINPDYIYVLLSGSQANDFMIQYRNQCGNRVPVIGTPFMTESSNLPMLGQFAGNLESISPWDKKTNNPENQEFCKRYMETYRAEPDLFALLGYETGAMTYQALANSAGDYSGPSLRKCLSELTFSSPRGEFSVDKESGWTKAPLYHLRAGNQFLNSQPAIAIINKLHPVEATHTDFALLENDYRSGWLNPYLFV